MRVKLTSFLQSATGPYGGRANHQKLVTRKDGQILIVPRKTSMTGDNIYNVMEWAKINWILVDCLWRNTAPRIRVEWGKCTRRTTDLATSNLDMFRKINMPRAMLGLPLLTLPPDKFESWCTYLPRPEQHSRHNTRPPRQIWVAGLQKPQPPWQPSRQEPDDPFRGNGPPPPEPFDATRGPLANPLVPSPSCAGIVCPDNVLYCYDELTCFLPVPFEPQLDKNYFFWQAYTSDDKTFRRPVWDTKKEIWSRRIWYGEVPYERVKATNIECQTDSWHDHPIPWGQAYCVRLMYICDPAVKLSYGYYWRDTADCCPDGIYHLAWVQHVYDTFPWPEQIQLGAGGTLLAETPCCIDIWGLAWQDHCPSGVWIANDSLDQWAGLAWYWQDNRFAEPLRVWGAGPSYLSVSNITCHDGGIHAGNWEFTIEVDRDGDSLYISYRRPVTAANPGIFGVYFKYDPNNLCPWAAYGVQVSDKAQDWNDFYPSLGYRIFQGVVLWCALTVASALASKGLHMAAIWSGMAQPYAAPSVSAAILNSHQLASALAHGTWRCQVVLDHGQMRVGNEILTKWAARRIISKVVSGF